MEHSNQIADLLYKYIRNELTADELKRLQSWVHESETNSAFFEDATNVQQLLTDARFKAASLENVDMNQLWQELKAMGWSSEQEKSKSQIIFTQWRWLSVAAAILLMITIGYLWLNKSKGVQNKKEEPVAAKVNDALPGKFKAKLTLADGTVVILDSANNQTIHQGSIAVKNKEGHLVYESKEKSSTVLYNTLTTGKGETYATLLSDGTKIWLNSQSSVRYPVSFNGSARKVEITGEAYFEVAPSIVLNKGKNAKLPFIVDAPGQEVEVLGTHFNINSYTEEVAAKTTLLEGKVKVYSIGTNQQLVLAPGEQAQLNHKTQAFIKTKDVDVNSEVAWRFGYFNFNNADLKTVMRQLERWYDMEVVYEGNVTSDIEFLGKIPRTWPLSQVLNLLQGQQVHFEVKGKKIIVSP